MDPAPMTSPMSSQAPATRSLSATSSLSGVGASLSRRLPPRDHSTRGAEGVGADRFVGPAAYRQQPGSLHLGEASVGHDRRNPSVRKGHERRLSWLLGDGCGPLVHDVGVLIATPIDEGQTAEGL